MGLRSTYRRFRFWQKIIFSDGAHSDLGWYVNKQNCRIWGTENPHAYIEKLTHPKQVTVWCGFWSRRIIRPFLSKERPLQSMVMIVVGPCWRSILATFSYNRTALDATQWKLHSMFCAFFWKIALSATELTSFDHIGAAIWHRWTIVCGYKCYADKPETIDALKNNIRKTIGEIQLHTIDNML